MIDNKDPIYASSIDIFVDGIKIGEVESFNLAEIDNRIQVTTIEIPNKVQYLSGRCDFINIAGLGIYNKNYEFQKASWDWFTK